MQWKWKSPVLKDTTSQWKRIFSNRGITKSRCILWNSEWENHFDLHRKFPGRIWGIDHVKAQDSPLHFARIDGDLTVSWNRWKRSSTLSRGKSNRLAKNQQAQEGPRGDRTRECKRNGENSRGRKRRWLRWWENSPLRRTYKHQTPSNNARQPPPTRGKKNKANVRPSRRETWGVVWREGKQGFQIWTWRIQPT